MFKHIAGTFVLMAAAAFGTLAVAADADPTLDQVYQAAQGGHLVQAQQMMQQVLRDHPDSARAHYVTAELDARAGDVGAAREELGIAERLKPGLPFASPQAVNQLRSQLAHGTRGGVGPNGFGVAAPAAHTGSIPWIPILLGLGVLVVIWVIMSRRRAAMYYAQGGGYPTTVGGGMPPTMGGPGYGGGYPAPGYGGGYPAPMGGGGSGLLGSLASGAALGAGVVAGEELMHHVLEPGAAGAAAGRPEEFERPVDPDPNANLGGNDFGIQGDSGWDDSSGGGFGGGDGGGDWS